LRQHDETYVVGFNILKKHLEIDYAYGFKIESLMACGSVKHKLGGNIRWGVTIAFMIFGNEITVSL
jgi:hypothetical protein